MFSFFQGGDPRLHTRHDRGEAGGFGETRRDPVRRVGERVFSFFQGGDPRLHARHDRGEAVGFGQTGGDPIRLISESRQDSFELRRHRAERALVESSDVCLARCKGLIWFGDLLNARFQANHALLAAVDLDPCRL